MAARLELLEALLAENPADDFTLFALAKEHEGLGDLDRALDFYEKLHTANADYVGLYYHLGKLWERLKEREKAISIYQKGIETAKKARDFHAASELQGALLNLGFEDDDDF